MNKIVLAVVLQVVAFSVSAQGSLDLYSYFDFVDLNKDERQPRFVHSISPDAIEFDSWTVSNGYYYPLLNKLNLYVASEVTSVSDHTGTSKGLLSGIEYNFNEQLSFSSAVQADRVDDETIGSVGMSSRLQVNEKIDLNASFEYKLNQQPDASSIYQIGVGYRF